MMRPKLEILAQEDVQKIIEAAYDLLENFGVKLYNQEALEILADGGAKVSAGRRKLGWIDKELTMKLTNFDSFCISCYPFACSIRNTIGN